MRLEGRLDAGRVNLGFGLGLEASCLLCFVYSSKYSEQLISDPANI